MEIFEKTVRLPVAAETAFAWYEQPGALSRLNPPWENVEEVQRSTGIRDGARAIIRARVAGISSEWEMEHRDYVAGKQFRDVMVRGPFAHWDHLHEFIPISATECILRDRVTYRLLGGAAGRIVAGKFTRRKLERMFRYRHRVTADDLLVWSGPSKTRPRILLAGASGLIGTALAPLLETRGYEVVRLVRKKPARTGECFWNPSTGEIDRTAVGPIDGIVNLSGENVGGGRWTRARKERIRESRIDATKTLLKFAREAESRPRVWINASATGYYGLSGERVVDEKSSLGHGFLAGVCRDWEAGAAEASQLGIRTVIARFGVVLSPRGGMLGKVLPLFRLGLGGSMGDGQAWLSWVAIDDAVGLLVHLLAHENFRGPINIVAPHPVRGAEFTAELARVLQRPAIIHVPAFALRAAFGEMADGTILASSRVRAESPGKSGYAFRFTELFAALAHLLGTEIPHP